MVLIGNRGVVRGIANLALLLFLQPTLAGSQDPMEPRGGVNQEKYIEEPAPWKEEGEMKFPSHPKALLELTDLTVRTPYRYQLDLASLIVGKDSVVRYTVVVTRDGGQDNIFYEGLRCTTGEYKGYAYDSGGHWQEVRNPTWRSLREGGVTGAYRLDLRERLCDGNHQPVKVGDMAQRLRYPPR